MTIELSAIHKAYVEFDWDHAKHERNVRERGLGFDHAALIFRGETLEREDDRRDYGEIRIQAIGEVAGQVFLVVYTDRGNIRRIISARRAHSEERAAWHAR